MKQRGRKALAVIPLDLDGYLFEWQGAKGERLRSRIAADFTGWETNNGQIRSAVRARGEGAAGG
jgi:hypothetical protein